MSESKNDVAWRHILEEIPDLEEKISSQGYLDIDGSAIKRHREPRLACKIDYRRQLPLPLKEQRFSVLAIDNGKYRIAKTDPFVSIDWSVINQRNSLQTFPLPDHIQALTPHSISSESKALDAALVSGMLSAALSDKVAPVLRGREFCGPIEFSLPELEQPNRRIPYRIKGVQVEVDGGYEGQKAIHLIEAKMTISDNLNLRQLLYPQLHYQQLYQKEVRTHVLLYEHGKGYFHFFSFLATGGEYQFSDYSRYALDGYSCSYRWHNLTETRIDLEQTDADVPFPQADDFNEVIAALHKLNQLGPLTKEEIFCEYDITPRQFDYYLNTLLWMKLAERVSHGTEVESGIQRYRLTGKGRGICAETDLEIFFGMAKIAFSNDLFNLFLHRDQPDISARIRERNRLTTESTFARRLQTVRRWKEYFRDIFPD